MEQIKHNTRIFTRHRRLRRKFSSNVSLKITAAFTIGIFCGLFFSEGKSLTADYFKQLSPEIAYNSY